MKQHLYNVLGSTAILIAVLWLALPVAVVVAAAALWGSVVTLWIVDVQVRRDVTAESEADRAEIDDGLQQWRDWDR